MFRQVFFDNMLNNVVLYVVEFGGAALCLPPTKPDWCTCGV